MNRIRLSAEEKLKPLRKIVIAVDNDTPGQKLAEELARRLGQERCWRATWPTNCAQVHHGWGEASQPCKDANDVLIHHGADVLRQCIDTATPWPVSGIMTVDMLSEAIEALYVDGVQRGLSPGWHTLEPLYTVKEGFISIITGIPSHGKSSWVSALTVNLAMLHGWRFCVFSPENHPLRKHGSRLMEKFIREPFRAGPTKRMSPERADEALEWVSWYFPMISPPDESDWTLDSIFKITEELVRRHGVKGLVIDPWNELEHVRPAHLSESEYIGLSLRKVRQFARRTGLHVWIVAHPAKMYRTKDGHYPMPTMYDISGSANWYNKPDNGLVIHRDKSKPDSPVEVHTQKIRFRETGEVGQVDFRYNKVLADYEEIGKHDKWSAAS